MASYYSPGGRTFFELLSCTGAIVCGITLIMILVGGCYIADFTTHTNYIIIIWTAVVLQYQKIKSGMPKKFPPPPHDHYVHCNHKINLIMYIRSKNMKVDVTSTRYLKTNNSSRVDNKNILMSMLLLGL